MRRTHTGGLTPPARRRRLYCGRRAFTLVEILLALALSAVLMVALYGAFDLYGRVTTAGRDDIERAQLARAILRMIELDIKSVVYREPATDAASTADMSSTVQAADETASEAGTMIAGEVESADGTTTTGESHGVYGDSTTLVLHISRPQRNVYAAPAEEGVAQPHASDLRSVSWFLSTAGADGVQGAVAEQASGGNATAADMGRSGLARLEGERQSLTLADESADTDVVASGATILAEEVTSLTFRYFDGAAWVDTWDCEIMGRLPQAIEITLGLALGRPNTALPAYGEAEIVNEELWRLVVSLPTATPATGEVLY